MIRSLLGRGPIIAGDQKRCVLEHGFGGCSLNLHRWVGGWPLQRAGADRPILKLTLQSCDCARCAGEIYISGSCNPALRATGAYYIAADTVAIMQMAEADLFADSHTLRFTTLAVAARCRSTGPLPRTGEYAEATGAGRTFDENLFLDTCVDHQPGGDLLAKASGTQNILFGSEMVGAVRGVDPETGHNLDDTKRYIGMRAMDETGPAACARVWR